MCECVCGMSHTHTLTHTHTHSHTHSHTHTHTHTLTHTHTHTHTHAHTTPRSAALTGEPPELARLAHRLEAERRHCARRVAPTMSSRVPSRVAHIRLQPRPSAGAAAVTLGPVLPLVLQATEREQAQSSRSETAAR